MADLQSLKNFVVLARLKSFSRAAEQCNVTASGLSRRIQALETWLGGPVFNRNSQQLELTYAGEKLLEAALDVIPPLESVRNLVRRQSGTEQNHIRMAAPHVMSTIFFPTWLSVVHAWSSEVKLSVTSAVMNDCMAALKRNEVDFVVCFDDHNAAIDRRLRQEGLMDEIQSIPLADETLVPISIPDTGGQPLYRLDGARSPLPYLAFSDECSIGWALEEALELLPGLQLRQENENRLADGLRSMALVGMGVAWLPQKQVESDLLTGRLVRAGPGAFDVRIGIRMLRTAAPLGKRGEALWEMLQKTG